MFPKIFECVIVKFPDVYTKCGVKVFEVQWKGVSYSFCVFIWKNVCFRKLRKFLPTGQDIVPFGNSLDVDVLSFEWCFRNFCY